MSRYSEGYVAGENSAPKSHCKLTGKARSEWMLGWERAQFDASRGHSTDNIANVLFAVCIIGAVLLVIGAIVL